MQNGEGLFVMCGVCCVWPLAWAAGAWWLRGRLGTGSDRKTLWELWTRQ